MTDNVTHLPQPGVDLDLDTLEPEEQLPPFVARVNGRNISFANPADLDWQDLAAVERPIDLLRAALSRDDRRHLQDAKISGYKFNKLLEAYYDHFKLEEKIEEAKRRQRAGL